VAPVVRLEGTEASWWSSGMIRRHRIRTQGGQRREGASTAIVPDDGRQLACAAVTSGEGEEEERVSGGDRSTRQ
jgi:hypothetical protein